MNKRKLKINGTISRTKNSSSFVRFFCRDNLSKQLKIINDQLKTDNLNLLQEQCAELVKENKIMNIKLDATQKDWNIQLNLLDSELNTVGSCLYRYMIYQR